MFGIHYLKAEPTTFILHYKNGKVVRQGAGLSFFYYGPSSSIVSVPLGTRDVLFAINELSGDFQMLTIQGQLTVRVVDPLRLAELLNFAIGGNGRYTSDDPDKLNARLVHTIQEKARNATRRFPLREVLTRTDEIVAEVLSGMRGAESVTMLGVQIVGLTIDRISPVPEMAKALEAEAREALQQRADQAIYDRRNAAVEQERRIRESEMATEIMVAEKQRQIRETQIAADIAIEEQRAALIEKQAANERKAADTKAYAMEQTLAPLRATDWRTLLAANSSGFDSASMIALAFRDLADNAEKIGELNISPDLLRSLIDPKPGKKG